MASVYVEGVEDLNRLAVDFMEAGPETVERGELAVRKTGNDVVTLAQVFVPVDTGATKNSIGADFDPDGLGFEAGPTTNYAHFLEYGTSKMAPRAFMGPAFDRVIPSFVQAVEQLGGRVLE